MSIDKINFTYPKGTLQSVFDAEEMTALELAAKTSKKVDECVDLVNGVEQSAIEATATVDNMKIAQEQFMNENNDIRQLLVTDNQAYIDTFNTSKATFEANMTTELNNFKTTSATELNNAKASIDLSLSNYQSTATTALNTFTTDINATKTQVTTEANNVIANSSQQITNDVNTKVTALVNDGTIKNIVDQQLLGGLNTAAKENVIIVSDVEPTDAHSWFKIMATSSIPAENEQYIFVNI
jgi:paraquat-inducible protein B